MRWFIIAAVAGALFILLSPFAMIAQVLYRTFSKRYDLQYYWNAVAVGIDDLGASILFGSKRHTISAIVGYKSDTKGVLWRYAEMFIDKLTQEKYHCHKQAVEEGLTARYKGV